MKKFLTGVVCLAAIVATSVVLLPVAAVKIATRLSKPRDKAREDRPHAEAEQPSTGLLMEPYKVQG